MHSKIQLKWEILLNIWYDLPFSNDVSPCIMELAYIAFDMARWNLNNNNNNNNNNSNSNSNSNSNNNTYTLVELSNTPKG